MPIDNRHTKHCNAIFVYVCWYGIATHNFVSVFTVGLTSKFYYSAQWNTLMIGLLLFLSHSVDSTLLVHKIRNSCP